MLAFERTLKVSSRIVSYRNENSATELLCAVQSIGHTNVIEEKFMEKGTTGSAVYAMAQCLSVCHKLVFYLNG